LTEEQIAAQRAAVDAMKNAKSNMTQVLERNAALVADLHRWLAIADDIKKYVPDMFESKHHDQTPAAKLLNRVNTTKTLL